jgi:uncharacterized tellurite resistance protein B-like protein
VNSEKHQILSDMIRLAMADDKIDQAEYNFISAIAARLGVTQEEVEDLFKSPLESGVFKTELERITQFHRLVLLMNVDQETHVAEVDTLRNYGLKMGIRPEAIEQVLNEMGNYENKVIPNERLIEIFSRFYN